MINKKLRNFIWSLGISLTAGLTFGYFYTEIAFSNEDSYKVIRVIDGDTVVLNTGDIVRYIGIDTPELREKVEGKWVYNPQPFAEEAREFNKKLVAAKKIKLEFDVEKYDNYQRLLAYVFADNVFVNAKMLEEGFALLYTKPPNVKYVDLFVKLQKQARENNKGLWGLGKRKVISVDEARKFIGTVKTVEGVVKNVYTSGKLLYLNFNKDFKGIIFKKNLALFKKEDINPFKDYVNKKVQLFGLIKKYNTTEIIISHPCQIEIIK